MAYCDADAVSEMTLNLIAPNTRFDETTKPTARAVERWLSSGCAMIETQLAAKRYTIPVPEGTAVYDMMAELNCLYAAAKAELSRSVATLQLGERTRGQVLMEYFQKELVRIINMDLTLSGATKATGAGRLYVGGVTSAGKDAAKEDIEPSMKRGLFDISGTIQRENVSSGSESGAIKNAF